MKIMIRREIKKLIKQAVKQSFNIDLENIEIGKPIQDGFGDYSANIAMVLAKKLNKDPKQIAQKIVYEALLHKVDFLVEKVEAAGKGFINFFIAKEHLQNQVAEILKQGKKFGNLKIGKANKINLEFISANPTGPLTLGNGRGGFCGDVLANVLEKAGYKVCREYYMNDQGEQIKKLGHSVIKDSKAVYKGKYIDELRKKIKKDSSEKVGKQAAELIMKNMIKPTIVKMGINFDVWFSENELYEKKEVEKTLKNLEKKNLVYKKNGALWFKSAQFGDDKDRVLIKADDQQTYFLSDIAYLKNKFKRGFNKLIFFWGADHCGYIGRMKAAISALGYKKEQADFIIMQMVRLLEKGKERKMSKRQGIYVTLDELIDEVGLDVARFFFLSRSPGSHLNFDLDLAKEQSEKNPVYYAQYAYARIHSILAKAKNYKLSMISNQLLTHRSEIKLIKQLIRLPEIVEDTAQDYQVQRLPEYAVNLAKDFHQFYTQCRVISDDKDLFQARLALISAVKIVLKNILDLMAISAPEKM